MFLKFRTGEKGHTSWKVIDKVKQVDYRYMDEPEFGENDNYINVFPDVKNKTIAQVIIKHDSGLREEIFTDDIVYILNDKGHTCDTINV